MITYKLVKDYFSKEVNGVIKTDENITMSIPKDEANTDYQEYLKWVAEGNEPEPADE